MKNIYRILLSSLFVVSSAIGNAQTTGLTPGQGPNGLEMSKILTKLSDYEYKIDIETYVTGAEQTTVVETIQPMDVCLILDRSVSVVSNAYEYVFEPEMLAATAFANALYDEKNRPKDAEGNLGYHYVAALSMYYAGIYSDFDQSCITNESNVTDASKLKFTEFNETNKNALVNNYTKYKNGGGSYRKGQNVMQVALNDAKALFGSDKSDRSKVIVIFTAGGSMQQKQGGGNGEMDYPMSIQSINLAKELKDSGVSIYVVSIEQAQTSPKGHTKDLVRYYHYLSSNYNFKITNSKYEFDTNYPTKDSGGDEEADKNEKHYYRTGKSTDASELAKELEDIFKSIAEESTSGGASVKLTESSTTVVDVVTDGFNIPEGASGITLKAALCTGKNTDDEFVFASAFDIPDVTYFPNASFYLTDDVTKTVPVEGGKVLKVNGFDFSKYFVGYRENKSNPSLSKYDGYKLIISFRIVIDASNGGGANVPTNTIQSGVWNEGKQISAFEQPNAKIPNLVILKKGLKHGESAIFNVSHDSSTKPTTVVLTQTGKDGDDVQKVIKIQKPGRYSVTEKSDWSWSYTSTLTSVYTKDDKDMDVTSDEGKAIWKTHGFTEDGANLTPMIPTKLGTETSGKTITRNVNDFTEDETAKGTLFIFENTKTTTGIPAHAEAMSNNIFGTGTSETVKTE